MLAVTSLGCFAAGGGCGGAHGPATVHLTLRARTDSRVGTGAYPAALENRMYTSCQLIGAAPEVCRCRLRYIESHTSVSALLRSSYALLRGGRSLPKWAVDATVPCGD